MSDRDGLITEIPPREGIYIYHVLSGYEGIVGRIDLRHLSGTPHVRIDQSATEYKWFPVTECRWTSSQA